MNASPDEVRAAAPSRAHLRRLRQYYRSAGWPCHDNIEIDLLAAGLVERSAADAAGLERLRVTEAGLAALSGLVEANRRGLDAHEALCRRVAESLLLEGRVVYRRLALRAPVEGGWPTVRPDVYSLRNTTHENFLAPLAHEIKVSRADLLCDLRNPAKRSGYQALSERFYYVVAEGLCEPDEIPGDCGLIVARADRLETLRTAAPRAVRLGVLHWMSLAKATPEADPGDSPQLDLVESDAARQR